MADDKLQQKLAEYIEDAHSRENLDLRGKEEELDEIYQQQIQAKVVGKIVDEDAQPKKMEVEEVEPA